MTVTLGEGNTPLIQAPRLSERLDCELWLKLESMNPTGSFKDRGMTVAVTRALERRAPGVVCASTGNTAASAAAYAARAGLRAVILVPAGAVAIGKLAQARAVGAELREVEGSFEQAHALARKLAEEDGFVNVNSINPDRIEGQATAADEIVAQLGGRPLDALALPYGGGGNTVAYARGFDEAGTGVPRLLLGEAAERARTFASAIRIADPVHRAGVEVALARSQGLVVSLSEERIAAAWAALGRDEGVFCEPASAAGLAAVEAASLPAGSRVVCVITGHGLKDPEAVGR